MRQIIYKFLDESIGSGVKLNVQHDFYGVHSNNNTQIFSFRMKDNWEWVKLYRYAPLCRKISGLFSVSEDEAARFISNWFGEKYGLKKVGDLRKFENQLFEL